MGEEGERLARLEEQVAGLRERLAQCTLQHSEQIKRVETHLERCPTEDRIKRLEALCYGAAALILSAVVTAGLVALQIGR